MSVRHLALVADVTSLPPTCKLLLYALAVNADGKGYVRMTNADLQRGTGLSERAIRSNMVHLKKWGCIVAQEKPGRFYLPTIVLKELAA